MSNWIGFDCYSVSTQFCDGKKVKGTVYPMKYEHGFLVLCLFWSWLQAFMNACDLCSHILRFFFTGTEAIISLPTGAIIYNVYDCGSEVTLKDMGKLTGTKPQQNLKKNKPWAYFLGSTESIHLLASVWYVWIVWITNILSLSLDDVRSRWGTS